MFNKLELTKKLNLIPSHKAALRKSSCQTDRPNVEALIRNCPYNVEGRLNILTDVLSPRGPYMRPSEGQCLH